MSAMKRGAALLVATMSVASVARGDTPPSVWDRAKNPDVGDSYRLHVEVQRRLSRPDYVREIEQRFPGTVEAQELKVRSMLEKVDAAKSPDPRLRYDLALVYLRLAREDPSLYAKAAAVAERALAFAPDHPLAEQGWHMLSDACGHIGDHVCERRAYTEVLRRTPEEQNRALPTLNLAETEMHLGNLREAAEGYREALRLAARGSHPETAPLAKWGLAVALDRAGDRVGAEREAREALELERSMGWEGGGQRVSGLLHTHDVFFVPDYEVTWYEGLGASALAKAPDRTAEEAARLWQIAERMFTLYIRGAEHAYERDRRQREAKPEGERGPEAKADRWLELAKLRLATAKMEREKAEKRRARESKPKAPSMPGEEMNL